jgi:hypothetical protein
MLLRLSVICYKGRALAHRAERMAHGVKGENRYQLVVIGYQGLNAKRMGHGA